MLSLMPVCYGSRLVSRDIDGLIGKKARTVLCQPFVVRTPASERKGQVTFQDFIVVAHYGLL
jgi:hypothetical protein